MNRMINPDRLKNFSADEVVSEVIDRRVYAIPGESTPVKRVFSVPELQAAAEITVAPVSVVESPEGPRHRAQNASRFAGLLKLSAFRRNN